jgi:hypothetical protein
MADLERCWLCRKILPLPTNPPEIHAEDLCDCLELSNEEYREVVDAWIQRKQEEEKS